MDAAELQMSAVLHDGSAGVEAEDRASGPVVRGSGPVLQPSAPVVLCAEPTGLDSGEPRSRR